MSALTGRYALEQRLSFAQFAAIMGDNGETNEQTLQIGLQRMVIRK